MKVLSLLLLLVLCLPSLTATAATTGCTSEDARAAEAAVTTATVKSWHEVDEDFKRYAQCDDGAIGEGFSDSITVLLANQWKTVRYLKAIFAADPKFQDFVVKHVDATVPDARLKKITANAEDKCPKELTDFCSRIVTAANSE